MDQKKQIKTPLDDAAVRQLYAGDEVLISGCVLTARDQAHKRLCERISQGQPLPVDLTGALIYFVGPTPAAPGRAAVRAPVRFPTLTILAQLCGLARPQPWRQAEPS